VPKGEEPIGYTSAIPELVVEVVSPAITRGEIATKIGEYLNANVIVVCVVDPEFQTVNLHTAALPVEKLTGDEPLTFADLPGFSLPVRKLFD
jgi:Uma2 family endonuclease